MPGPQTDAFVAKLKPDGSGMIWATYLGGKDPDVAQSLAIDPAGAVWVAGTTSSSGFPNSNGWSTGSEFLAELKPDASALLYSARFPAGAAAQSIAVDPAGLVHAVGLTGIASTVNATQAPSPSVFGISNAAGLVQVSGRIAPGELISICGPHVGPPTPATLVIDGSGRVATTLSGTTVLIGGVPAPLLYVSDTQINAVVPFGISAQTSTHVRVTSHGTTLPDFPVTVVSTAPGIFLKTDGSAAALNQDGSLNSASNPAKSGSVITFWATGTGAVDALDGEIPAAAKNYYCCTVSLGFGTPPDVLYAGASPGLVAGVTQVNLRLPDNLYPAVMYMSIVAGNRTSAAAAIYVSD
jgi:uncharacterized protein (TIGR03437 family)